MGILDVGEQKLRQTNNPVTAQATHRRLCVSLTDKPLRVKVLSMVHMVHFQREVLQEKLVFCLKIVYF
jgi:hypothetical protein